MASVGGGGPAGCNIVAGVGGGGPAGRPCGLGVQEPVELLEDGEDGDAISGMRSTLLSLGFLQGALAGAVQAAGFPLTVRWEAGFRSFLAPGRLRTAAGLRMAS